LNILHGVADVQDVLIVLALAIKAISSINTALYVPHLHACGFALSPVIAPVLSGLDIVLYLLFSVQLAFSKPLGNIHWGRFLIINLAFSNKDFISPILSTSSSFCDTTRYL